MTTASKFNNFDYYSGSQITIWFGNILIDDIYSIQWARSQGKRPIYGYASQQFDAVAKGTVIIQGNFVVNFRQRGYLPAVFKQIESLYKVYNKYSAEGDVPYDNSNWDTVSKIIGTHLKNDTFGPSTAAEIAALGQSEDFIKSAEMYEEVIWGGVSLINREGKPTQGAADVAQNDMIPDGFNIMISYGDVTEGKTISDQMRSTTKTLTGVHIVGEGQNMQVGGQPCMEQYEFIARGTDENIGTAGTQ